MFIKFAVILFKAGIMKQIVSLVQLIIPITLVFIFIFSFKKQETKDVLIAQIEKAGKNASHASYAILQQDFERPQDVTNACLTCHESRGREVMQTAHWNWTSPDTLEDGRVVHIGKKNVINNYCVGINSNEALCSGCHIGYGYSDKHFDFGSASNIDCLVCHDNTGSYSKAKGKSGMPAATVDLRMVAQAVGPSRNTNCLSCHAKGGGGNNVKHGDLDVDLANPERCDRNVDVHLALDGAGLNCSQCHITRNHQIQGAGPMTNSFNLNSAPNRASCYACHTDRPHSSPILNDHYAKVACQTCHIPRYAKLNPTKMSWDWSTATQLREGAYYEESSDDGLVRFDSKHGTSTYAKEVKPAYRWWNGIALTSNLDTKIKVSDTLDLNPLQGGYQDKESKIYPFKITRSKLPYDTEYLNFLQFRSFGPPGSGALWSDYDWDKAVSAGMEYLGRPYSGKMAFMDTRSYWPLHHMVSPATQALQCADCHSRNGVLADLDGFYLPGRDVHASLDFFGIAFLLLSVLGVLAHTILRIRSNR